MRRSTKTKTSKKSKSSKTSKKVIEQSVVKRGKLLCINSKKNKTPYWGGEKCDSYIPDTGTVVRWVCDACVAKMMPIPRLKKSSPPPTGEKRKRGRPKGSKNKK